MECLLWILLPREHAGHILYDYLEYYGSSRGHLGKAHRISKFWTEEEVIAVLKEHRLKPVAQLDRFLNQDADTPHDAVILVCRLGT